MSNNNLKKESIILIIFLVFPIFVFGQADSFTLTNDTPTPTQTTADTGQTTNTSPTNTSESSSVTETTTNTNTNTNTGVTISDSDSDTNIGGSSLPKNIIFGNKRDDDQIKRDIETVSKTIRNLDEKAQETESEVKDEIDLGIDGAIHGLSDNGTDSNLIIDSVNLDRDIIKETVRSTLREGNISDSSRVNDLGTKIDTSLGDIENKFNGVSGVEVDLSKNRRSIKNTLIKYRTVVASHERVIQQRSGEKVFRDTDDDGLSDYDEEFIYNTNPNSKYSGQNKVTDAESILLGVDPISGNKIMYEDPRESLTSVIVDSYTVDRIETISSDDLDTETKSKIKFMGRGLPNSFVTIYIYSTPIIVTVRTDEIGEWEYTLNKELEDGNHDIFVATVNNSGRIVAQSNKVPFVKTAEAATLDIAGSIDSIAEYSSEGDRGFFKNNLVLLSVLIAIIAIIFVIMIIGGKPVRQTMDEIKDEVKKI